MQAAIGWYRGGFSACRRKEEIMPNRPKPTALKKLQGNPGNYPLNDMEPQPPVAVPEMPKGLRPAARREWHRIVVELLKLGVLTVVDGKALAMYCDAYADWQEAQRDCTKNGLVLDTPVLDKEKQPIYLTGMSEDGVRQLLLVRKINPAFTVKIAAMKTMKSFLIEFGLTPASRSKLKVAPPPKVDPMEEFLKGRANESAPASPKSGDTPKEMPTYFKTGMADIGRTDA